MPLPSPSAPNERIGTIVISGGFLSGEETNGSREVYATKISTKATLEKRIRPNQTITICFSNEDMEHVTSPHDDALAINAEINGFDVKRVLVDSGSSSDVDAMLAMEGQRET